MAKRNLKIVTPAPAPKKVLTRSAKAAECVASIKQYAEWGVKNAERDLAEFTAKFAKDPAYALSWSDGTFSAAARHSVSKLVLEYLSRLAEPQDEYTTRSDEEVLKVMQREFSLEVLRNAKWPERSTSPASNEMALRMMSARAEWLEKMDNHLAAIARTEGEAE
jgi:hypothetical protein